MGPRGRGPGESGSSWLCAVSARSADEAPSGYDCGSFGLASSPLRHQQSGLEVCFFAARRAQPVWELARPQRITPLQLPGAARRTAEARLPVGDAFVYGACSRLAGTKQVGQLWRALSLAQSLCGDLGKSRPIVSGTWTTAREPRNWFDPVGPERGATPCHQHTSAGGISTVRGPNRGAALCDQLASGNRWILFRSGQ